MNLFRALTLVLLLALGAGVSSLAFAQGPAFLFIEAEHTFGQEIRVSLTVDGQQPVEQLTLFLQSGDPPQTFAADVAITPSAVFSVTERVDLTAGRGTPLPPFATVSFWWELVFADGSRLLTSPEQLFYEDDQFDWRLIERNGIQVRWPGDDPALGPAALDVAEAALPRLTAVIPTGQQPSDPAAPIRIYLYPTAGDLRAALRLTGRDWVGAHADPALGVILVTAVNPRTAAADLRQSIPHELSHLLLYQATGPAYANVPRWLDEGLATLLEAAPNPNYEALLHEAVRQRATIPLADLCTRFPADETAIILAYAQSGSLLRYLQAEYGNAAIVDLIGRYADGAACDSGVRQALGLSLGELELNWLRQLEPLSPAARFIRDNAAWLALLLGGFALSALLLFNPAAGPGQPAEP